VEEKSKITMIQSVNSACAEEARIRAAYARREKNDERYSWFNPGYQMMVQECERRMLSLLMRSGFGELQFKTTLEVGCGTGHWLREFVKWGVRPENVTGIDLLPDRLLIARQLCAPAVRIQRASAASLPFSSESFDIVLQATVFTSILDEDVKRQAAAEMLRVLKPNGVILWYDYHVNNPRNPDVRGVKRREIDGLFPSCRIELERLTLVPPLARFLARYSSMACYLLAKISPLCTHYLGVMRKVSREASSEFIT
jgi:ubiquinone/menaquinone biosynthesis C-methylase UbiE